MKSFIKYSALGILSAGLAGLALAGAAAAHDKGVREGDRAGARFEKLDANADGFVTADDMTAVRLARFNEQDSDGDGFLSLQEMQDAAMRRFEGRDRQPDAAEFADRSQRMLRFLDDNGDGKVAFAELPNYRGDRMIERLDSDGDSRISRTEFDAARGSMCMGRMDHRGWHHD